MFGGMNTATGEYRSSLYELMIDDQALTLEFK